MWRVIYNTGSPKDRVRGQELPFPGDYTALMTGKKIAKKRSLRKLCPLIDNQGIIQCDGRLQFAECRMMSDFLLYCKGSLDYKSDS